MTRYLILGLAFLVSSVQALTLTSTAFDNGGLIDTKYALCRSNGLYQRTLGGDISPQLSWTDVPKGTQSFALIVADHDVPQNIYVNVKDKWINPGGPRNTVYHWVVADISADLRELKEGTGSAGYDPNGKPIGKVSYGLTGKNIFSYASADYAKQIGAVKNSTTFGGYEGPCPPFNDMSYHHYHFTLYALDVKNLALPADGNFTGDEVLAAMHGHILAHASLVGRYTNNQKLIREQK